MPTINRKTAPQIQQVGRLELPRPELIRLDNGVPVYVLDYPDQEIVKIEAVFLAGRPHESKHLASRATSRLLREGTRTRNGSAIAEHLDYYGASLSVPANLDTASFILFSLKKYAAEVIPVFTEILQEPAFPLDEIENFRRNSIQELQVELEKVETVAYRKITELIFGETHPYGYNSTIADYQAIQQTDVRAFYDQWYTRNNCILFASGRIDEGIICQLNEQLQGLPSGNATLTPPVAVDSTPAVLRIPQQGSLQTAIKIGRRLFNRNHPDFNGMTVLNTVLGGYFGSRLMTNIREKNGYTYNIYSTVDAYLYDGCFYIATEVNPEKAKAAQKAIFSELKKLREQPVPEAELSMVRNYILGMLLNGLDGPINSSDMLRNLIIEKQSPEQFNALVETVRHISAETLQALAQRYFQEKDFWVVTVG